MPLVQGGTISFLVPTLAILNLPQWQCPAPEVFEQMSHENRTELWQIRMRELSGAIAVSALFQVIIGFGGTRPSCNHRICRVIPVLFFYPLIFSFFLSWNAKNAPAGIIGYLLKFITPLTIVPTVSLVGLSLFENAADAASQHWGIAAGYECAICI